MAIKLTYGDLRMLDNAAVVLSNSTGMILEASDDPVFRRNIRTAIERVCSVADKLRQVEFRVTG